MRLFVLLLALVAADAAAAQDFPPAVRRYIQTELQPHARAYERCAEQHLRDRAAATPYSTFDAHEASIKPVCGHHIRTIIAAVIGVGQNERSAIDLVNDYYGYVQPKLRNAFETQAALRRSELEIAAARERERQRMSAEQKRLLDAEVAALEECLDVKIEDFALFSTEKAETLADAAMTSCSPNYARTGRLLAAVFNIGEEVDSVMQGRLRDDRRYLVAKVVAIRAELVKRAIQGARPDEATPPPTGQRRLY
jgi:hypothetical protein